MKASLLRVTGSVASVASCLVLFGGVASAQVTSTTNATIDHTGEDSHNVIEINDKCEVNINNNNNVTIVNENTQVAESGDASAGGDKEHENGPALLNEEHHEDGDGTSVDDVTSGDASNTNNTNVNVNIDNRAYVTCFLMQQTPPPAPVGGSGAGTVTPTVTPVATTAVGGSGAGEGFVAQQVAALPVGGVGAGTGGLEYLSGLAAVTLLSGAWATRRLQRSFKS